MTSPDVTYDKLGRMQYHPDYHPNHKRDWTTRDIAYLIENYEKDGPEAVSLALGRTIHTVMHRACALRKAGAMPPRHPKTKNHTRLRPEAKETP